MQRRGVGYLRISDRKQIDGESPETQRRVIQDYANREGIEIIEWFYDEAKSGKNTDRKELTNLLKFVIKRSSKIDDVIVFKLNRASRDIASYYNTFKAVLATKGIQMRSATEYFDDSPIGRFIEGVLVLNGQLDNEIKGSAVSENMRSLARQGYWQHKPLLGYDKHRIHNDIGKPRPTLKPNSVGNKVKIVLERFSTGDITQAQLTRYAEEIGLRSIEDRVLDEEAINRMLNRPEYAGYVHGKLTDYELVEGKHTPLISQDTYWLNQRILNKKTKKGGEYSTKNTVFPIKQVAVCANCSEPLYGSSPRNGSGVYSPRYHCARRSCKRVTASVSVDDVHDAYMKLLDTIQPTSGLLALYKDVLIKQAALVGNRLNSQVESKRHELDDIANARLKAIEDSVLTTDDNRRSQLLELIAHMDTKKADKTLELRKLEEDQTVQESKISYAIKNMYDIANQWNDAEYDLKLKFQSMVFPKGLTYDTKNRNFGTAELSPLYRYIMDVEEEDIKQNSYLVALRGIEPRLPE